MTEDRENDNPDEAVDPLDHQGGGGQSDSADEESKTVDPPDHQGGGG